MSEETSVGRGNAPREQRYCEREGKVTEWRRYKIERTWLQDDDDHPTGPYRYQWRCYSCLRRKDNENKARRRREEREARQRQQQRPHPTSKIA